MKLSRIHLDFWQARKAPLPRFARGFKGTAGPSIDSVINANAGLRQDRLAAGNLIAILKMQRKHVPSLRHELDRVAATPGCLIDPKRRASYARLWADRIARQPEQRA